MCNTCAAAADTRLVRLLRGTRRRDRVQHSSPDPVDSGPSWFTSAAAVVIAASQLGALLGVKLPASTGLHTILGELWAARARVHVPTLLVGLAAVLTLLRCGSLPSIGGESPSWSVHTSRTQRRSQRWAESASSRGCQSSETVISDARERQAKAVRLSRAPRASSPGVARSAVSDRPGGGTRRPGRRRRRRSAAG